MNFQHRENFECTIASNPDDLDHFGIGHKADVFVRHPGQMETKQKQNKNVRQSVWQASSRSKPLASKPLKSNGGE